VPDSVDAVFAGPELACPGMASLGQVTADEGSREVSGEMGPVPDAARTRLERDLMQCATALSDDAAVARIVTDLTLARMDRDAAERETAGLTLEPPGQVTLFRMVRQAYHSIERTRVRRAPRPSMGGV